MTTGAIALRAGSGRVTRIRLVVRLLLRWLIGPLATVFVSTAVIYSALSFAPGDPVAQLLGDKATNAQRAAMRTELGLDQPLPVRFVKWLGDALHGDLGISTVYRQQVTVILAPRIETSLLLVVMSALLIVVCGIAFGIIGGTNRRANSIVSAVIGLAIALPGYVLALILMTVFAVGLGWFPTIGGGTGFVDQLWHLTLPTIALSLSWIAYVAQISSAAVREESTREHVMTAVARGLPRSTIIRRHILRNAAVPILTASGLTIAGLVAGSVVVESAFGVDGIGSLLVKSVEGKDYSPVTAIAVLIVIAFVVTTTLVDVVQTLLDPKRRASQR